MCCRDLADYNTLAALPGLGPLAATVKLAQRRLPALIQTQQDKEKDQVFGQLKDLGNTVLGKSVHQKELCCAGRGSLGTRACGDKRSAEDRYLRPKVGGAGGGLQSLDPRARPGAER